MSRPLLMISLFAFLFGTAVAQDETPAARTTRETKDRAVLRALAQAGSNLRKPHRIEFHFVSAAEPKLAALVEEAKTLGYAASTIHRRTGSAERPYWSCDLIQDVVPGEQAIFAHTATLTKLARSHGVEYDGWGCQVVE